MTVPPPDIPTEDYPLPVVVLFHGANESAQDCGEAVDWDGRTCTLLYIGWLVGWLVGREVLCRSSWLRRGSFVVVLWYHSGIVL